MIQEDLDLLSSLKNNISLKNYLSSYALDPLDINFKFTDFQNKIEKETKI